MERSDSQNYNVGKKYMGKKASAAAPVAAAKKAMSAVKPCAKKKTDRISIFSPWANRMVSVITAKPIVVRNSIGADTIGVKIDPVALFSGKLRVLLRDANHIPVVAGAAGGQMNPATEAWSATFLFVHKS